MNTNSKTVVSLLLIAVLIAGAFVLYRTGYRECWRCSRADFFQRGLEFSCKEDWEYKKRALKFIKKAADEGLLQARIFIAELYLEKPPEGYQLSFPEKISCLKKIAKADNKAAAENFIKAISGIRGKISDKKLYYNIGLLYLAGIIPSNDPVSETRKWFELAADAGHLKAMKWLAALTEKRDEYPEAMKWHQAVFAKTNDPETAILIGDWFMYGRPGIGRNYAKAMDWYRKAVDIIKKTRKDASEEELQIALDPVLVRMDIAKHKAGKTSGDVITIKYHIDGGLNKFIVFVEGKPDAPVGQVVRQKGGIRAEIEKDISLPEGLPREKDGFKSMQEGLEWVLHTYATAKHGPGKLFTFVMKAK